MTRRRQASQGPGSVSHEFSLLFELYAANSVGEVLVDETLGPRADAYAMFGVVRILGPITPSDAAALLGLAATTATDKIQRLVDQGIVERVPNPKDGRSYLLRITPEGERRWASSRPPFEAMLARIDANLEIPSDQVRAAIRALDSAIRVTLEELRTEATAAATAT